MLQRLPWKFAGREMRQHPGRALLTWLSVVIGVATVTAVGLSTRSARTAYQEMYQAITGRAALEISAAGGGPLELSLLKSVRETPGVRNAVPLIQRLAIMYYEGGRMKLVALGVDPKLDSAVRDYDIVAGKPLSAADGVLLNASLARSAKIKVGDRVKLLARRGLVRTTVVGLVEPRTGAAVSSGAVLLMPLAAAQQRFAARGRCDRIQVVLDSDADLVATQTRLSSRLPVGSLVRPPVTRSANAEETILALENGLRLATAFSLLSAVFIIMNTFLMNVGQRRRPLAVMRAIGATRGQIARLLFHEALLLGTAGTLAGVLVGWGGALLLNAAMCQMFQASLPHIEFRWGPLALAAAFGLGVSLLGAALPARKAARLTPLEGMSGVPREDIEGHSRLGVMAGGLVLLLAVGVLTACLVGRLPINHAVSATVLLLIGLVLLIPLVLRPLTRVVQAVLQPVAGVEARLARSQLLRHRGRTTLTTGVLFVAVGTGLGLAHSVLDNVADVRSWYRAAIVGDFYVQAAMPDMETGMAAGIPEAVGQEIRDIPGVTRVTSVRFISAKANEQPAIVVASERTQVSTAASTDPESPFAPPPGDDVLLGSVLAQRIKKQAGETITLETRDGTRDLRIAAVVNDYSAGGLTIHMQRTLAARLWDVEGVDAFVIKADHARLPAVGQALQAISREHGTLLHSYADMTAMIEGMMAGVVGSLWGLLVLSLVVAAFGVANTLGMNVLEQTRELGLLRVVAMTRGQVRKTIIAQAAMLGLLGVVPGMFAGMAMAYIMHLSTLPVIGHPVAFRWHPWLLLGGFLAAIGMALVAAWMPAERAARLPLAAALRYE